MSFVTFSLQSFLEQGESGEICALSNPCIHLFISVSPKQTQLC